MQNEFTLIGPYFAIAIAKVISCLFFSGLFLQSGLDKAFNYKAESDYMKGHLAKSPVGGMVGLMLPILMLMEIIAGALCLIGLIYLFMTHEEWIAFYGIVLAGFALILAFMGQRLAKDYAAAAGIVPYLLMVIGSMIVMGLPFH